MRKSCKTGGFFKIDDKKKQVGDLETKTHASDFWNDNQQAQQILQEISRLKREYEPWDELLRQVKDHCEMAELLESEKVTEGEDIQELSDEVEILEKQFIDLEFKAMLSGEVDQNNCFLQIHAGAGGTESCDWAAMLLRMYSRWSDKKGFKLEEIEFQAGEEAGVKGVTLLIKGPYAFGYLKAESGVHRLVRISPFDSNKRRHTSFASVFASPEIDDTINIEINESDIRIDTFKSGGHGGQSVNTTDSAIRIVHIPTGLTVSCQNERSQLKNKIQAMKVLRSRLYQYHLEKQREEQEKQSAIEKKDIAWGHQIRSYVFCPYQMVKDLRTEVETGNIAAVMDGEIDSFIEAYLKQTVA